MPLLVEVAESERTIADRVESDDRFVEQHDIGATKEFGLKSLDFFCLYEFVQTHVAAVEGIRNIMFGIVLKR